MGNIRVTEDLVALYGFDETTGSAVAGAFGVGTALNITINTSAATAWGSGLANSSMI
jgi:hypothetical protein